MPIYEYMCQECQSQAELLVQGSEQPECPKCGSAKLTKLLSVVAAPGRDAAAASGPNLSGGSCGSGCGCHP
jgi:putative FmdB family regulatory protein